ncbi:hypothetical protein LCGC14_1982000, partial [marine sediment metagenome]
MQRFITRQLSGITPLFTSIAIACALSPISTTALAEGFALEEVLVTARKREESMQEVPVAVSAFTGDSLKSLGITNVKDMEGIVPGLNMGGGGNGTKGDSNPFIRGVGQRESKVTIDSAVGTYIDGIYIGRAAGALLDAVDVESIQVLRGPQGTLFGKNTTGGAIVIQTTKPGPDLGGHVEVTYGNYGRRNGSGAVNVPLIDDVLYSRLTVASTKSDGYTENQFDNSNWNDDDRLMAIGQLRWDASEDVMVDILLSSTKTRQRSRAQKCVFLDEALAEAGRPNPTFLEAVYNGATNTTTSELCDASGELLPSDKFESELSAESDVFRRSVYEVDTQMAGVTIAWDMGELLGFESLAFKSISGYRLTEQRADEDLDGSAAALTGRVQSIANETDQYSQEFQFTGSAMDGRLNAILGLYAFLEQTDNDWLQDYASYSADNKTENTILLAQSNLTERETDNKAWAVFSQLSFDLTELTEVTVGIRYTSEERETTYREAGIYLPSLSMGEFCPTGGCPTTINTANLLHTFSDSSVQPMTAWQYGYDSNLNGNLEDREIGTFGEDSMTRKDDDWSPSLSFKMRASDDVLEKFSMDSAMGFITFSEGFRSGGVVIDNGDYEDDGINGINDMNEFKPEYVDNIEIGVKIDAFDNRLRANLTTYYTDYTDIQVTAIIPNAIGIPLPSILNAGKAVIKGVEGEFTYVPVETFRLTATFAYADGDYK